MCGHEKYLKTTMHGLTSLYPDYCLLIIGANMGISKMTKEHLGISWALNLPIIVVFTKLDLAPKEVYYGIAYIGRDILEYSSALQLFLTSFSSLEVI